MMIHLEKDKVLPYLKISIRDYLAAKQAIFIEEHRILDIEEDGDNYIIQVMQNRPEEKKEENHFV